MWLTKEKPETVPLEDASPSEMISLGLCGAVESPLPKRSRKSAGRSVSFHPQVQFREVAHIRDMTDNQIQRLWLAGNDYERIRKEVSVTLSFKKNNQEGDQMNEQEFCFRGLEHRTTSGAENRKLIRRIAWDSVLNEQEFQWECSVNIPEDISLVYQIVSLRAQRAAYLLAQKDKEAAENS